MEISQPVKRGQLLVKLRKQTSCKTRKEFCEKHGIPHQTMRQWEKGLHEGISSTGLKKLVEAFLKEGVNCSEEYILKAGDVSIETTSSNSKRILDLSLINTYESQRVCNELKDQYDNLEFAIITNDLFNPYILKDDIVVGKKLKANSPELSHAFGKLSIVQTIYAQTFVMVVERCKWEHLLIIRADKIEFYPLIYNIAEIEFVAPILTIVKRLDF